MVGFATRAVFVLLARLVPGVNWIDVWWNVLYTAGRAFLNASGTALSSLRVVASMYRTIADLVDGTLSRFQFNLGQVIESQRAVSITNYPPLSKNTQGIYIYNTTGVDPKYLANHRIIEQTWTITTVYNQILHSFTAKPTAVRFAIGALAATMLIAGGIWGGYRKYRKFRVRKARPATAAQIQEIGPSESRKNNV
jgi:hypothetical protein